MHAPSSGTFFLLRRAVTVTALLACAAMPAAAQVAPQPQPLVGQLDAPFDPLRPTPLQAPRQPIAPARGSEAPIEVGVLTDVDPSVVGLLDDPHGGLGIQMWRGTPRARVEMLLPRLPMGTFSPAMQDLAARLLLTTAVVPAGAPIAPSLIGLRVERLMAGGRISDVNELLRIVAAPVDDPALSRAEIDAMLLAGDYGGACGRVPALVQDEPAPHWLKTLAFCRALDRDTAAVTLATALLRDQGQVGDEAFFALIAALPGGAGGPPITSLVDPTPLHLAMLRAANQPVPADAVAGAEPAILWAIATAPKDAAAIPVEVLEAAERAEAAGALATDTLAEIYSTMSYTDAQIAAALDTAAKEHGPRVNALLYQAAQVWTDPAQRAAALQAAWKAGRTDGLFATAARVNLAALRALEPSPDRLPVTGEAARAALAAGDLPLAWRWLEVALRAAGSISPQGANSQAITMVAHLWPLLQLADPAGAATRSVARTGTWWQDLPKPVEGTDADRRALLYTLYAAMGTPLPREAWEPLLYGPALLSGNAPALALQNALAEAAAAKRIAETVLLTLMIIGDGGPDEAGGAALTQAIAALRAIGLNDEARAIAVEAALGHGF